LLTDFPNLKSIWSISDALFGISALATAMPIIGICTYIIVFNLNNIASILKPAWRSSSDLLPPLFNQQINGMRHNSNSAWKELRVASDGVGASQNGRSSYWGILQSSVGQFLWNTWSSVINLGMFVLKALSNRGGGERSERPGEQFSPAPLRNLGDVRVQVEIDVESCGASQKAKSDST
jgi:hypothetical protein